MERLIPEQELASIETLVSARPGGIALQDIRDALGQDCFIREGDRRWARYRLPVTGGRQQRSARYPSRGRPMQCCSPQKPLPCKSDSANPSAIAVRSLMAIGPTSAPTCARPGRRPGPQPAATYTRRILSRLLIDLSWNSSRLEGNSYSLLDAKRLIAFGAMAEGKA